MRLSRCILPGAFLFVPAWSVGQDLAIPFRLSSDNRIHVGVRIGSQGPLDFIFDTGADTCVVTERGRARLKSLAFGGHEATLGLGGTTTHPVERDATIMVDGYRRKHQTLMFIDYGGSLDADGVLPYTVFADRVIGIDYDDMRIHVSTGKPSSADASRGAPVTMRDGLPFIDATVSTGTGIYRAPVAVDTGFSGSATLSHDAAASAGLPGDLRVYGTAQLGGTGTRALRSSVVDLPRLALGECVLTDVPVDVQLEGDKGDKRWSFLGNELLKRANLTWDVPGRRMYFSPNRLRDVPYALPHNSRLRIAMTLLGLILAFAVLAYFLRLRRKRLGRPENAARTRSGPPHAST